MPSYFSLKEAYNNWSDIVNCVMLKQIGNRNVYKDVAFLVVYHVIFWNSFFFFTFMHCVVEQV